ELRAVDLDAASAHAADRETGEQVLRLRTWSRSPRLACRRRDALLNLRPQLLGNNPELGGIRQSQLGGVTRHPYFRSLSVRLPLGPVASCGPGRRGHQSDLP